MPPTRERPSWTVTSDAAGLRLDKFLADAERLGSRRRVADALAKGKVFVNGAEATAADAGSRVRAGDVVGVWMNRPGSARRTRTPVAQSELQILYEDDALLVVNKPAGLLAVPLAQRRDAGSAYDQIREHLRPRGRRTPLVVHRIDRDTSGLVVFAKTLRAQEELKDQFERREPERVYLAVVQGRPDPPEGTWRDFLVWDPDALLQTRAHPRDPRRKEAISHYRVVETFAGASLVEIRLETGKRNQIRMQARLRGHTLVGERLYADGQRGAPRIPFGRQALHASRLSFRHPTSGRPVTVEAPLPSDFAGLLARLRAP
ncbi:MAG: RluA family pseudouridine synthase [Acidobacteria bacterium]|nr:RluA family pseudouridine synthase [Acidobacteriota bacterium]